MSPSPQKLVNIHYSGMFCLCIYKCALIYLPLYVLNNVRKERKFVVSMSKCVIILAL